MIVILLLAVNVCPTVLTGAPVHPLKLYPVLVNPFALRVNVGFLVVLLEL